MNSPALRFRFRALTSLLMVVGFASLLLSGGVLFLSPPGRVANWTNWQILGLTKHGWSDLHIAFGALFLVAGLAHVVFNWRPLLQHLGARMGRVAFRLEWVAALVLGLGVWVGTRTEVPPFSTLLAWSERLRGSWEDNRDRAPIPHAELLSLEELARQAGVSTEQALRRLEVAGLKDVTADAQVQSIADAAHLTPARVYDLVRNAGQANAADGKGEHGPRGRSAGGGPGWKTLAQFCTDEGLNLEAAQARLTGRGFKFSADQTLREIAVNNGFDRPYALLEILRQ